MKRAVLLPLMVVTMVSSVALAQPAPVTLTVKSYEALTSFVEKVVDTISPGAGDEFLGELRQGLGIEDLEGIDKSRPWQLAVWVDSMSVPPCLSVRVPVSDFAAFRDGLQDGLLKGASGSANKIEQVGDHAKVWIQFGAPSAATLAAEKAWNPATLKNAAGVIGLVLKPSVAMRDEIVGGLGMGRAAVVSAMSSQAGQMPQGMDPQALGELMGVYFDLLETGVKGLETLDLRFDVEGGTLMVREEIVPVAGSDLASWFQVKEGDLPALSAYVSREAPMGLALRLEESPGLTPTLKRLANLSMRLQGLPAESDVIQKTEELFDAFLPMQFAGAGEMGRGVEFAGVYRFPGKDVNEVYGQMKEFVQKTMQQQVGADQVYESISVEEGHRKVGGISVDRTTMVLNLDAPLYQMPGQKEMMESLWPGGKMEIDYAVKGKDLLMGSPASLDALLVSGPSGGVVGAEGANSRTVAFGHVNLLKFLPSLMALNPGMTDEEKERISKLDSSGTAIDFQLDLDGRLRYRAGIPLKFLRAIGQVTQ